MGKAAICGEEDKATQSQRTKAFVSSQTKGLTRRCSEPRTVLIPKFESMRMSFLIRAVADLGSR